MLRQFKKISGSISGNVKKIEAQAKNNDFLIKKRVYDDKHQVRGNSVLLSLRQLLYAMKKAEQHLISCT